ncbi:hypothetical protein GOBAR_AA09430 [Gossypium barbadense]|uniref:Uncharacterized protein n=1 Tax=Gossypium barbadense TaxID=3634 RepID=A0A2P5Y6L3_GOSBA|nr:hypothetical protein GOBAR_AA09430 [Gossypium barbadense]
MRPRWAPIHPRTNEEDLSSTIKQESTPTVTPPIGQYVSSYSGAYTNHIIFTQAPYIPPHFSASTSMPSFIFKALSPMYYTSMPSTFPTMMTYRPFMFQELTESPFIMSSMYGTQHTYTHPSFVTQTLPGSLFYQGGSSF